MATYKKILLFTLTGLMSQTALIQAAALKTAAVRVTQAAQILGTSPQALKAAGFVRRGGWVDMSAARVRFSPINRSQSIAPIKHINQTGLLALPQPEAIIIDAPVQAATNANFFMNFAQASRHVLASIKKSAQQAGNKAAQYLQNKPVQTFGSLFAALGLTSGYLASNRQTKIQAEIQAANHQASKEITKEALWLLEPKPKIQEKEKIKVKKSWFESWFK